VVLVDLPPDDLLQRLKEGKVYLPQQAERAIRNFFRKGNLIALRELALRRTADRVDDEMLAYRRETSVATVWQTRDALLVCIGSGTGARDWCAPGRAWQGDWRPPGTPFTCTRKPRDRSQRWSGSASSARSNYPLRSVLKRRRSRLTTRSRACRLCSRAQPVATAGRTRSPAALATLVPFDGRPDWTSGTRPRRGAGGAQRRHACSCRRRRPPRRAGQLAGISQGSGNLRLATGLAMPLAGVIELTNIAMLFLLAVLIVAMHLGRGPAVASSFMAVAAFDFFFVEPRLSFAVSDAQYLMTFAVMLTVALITGQLTARYKQHADVATQREARARALYEMARDLSAALLPIQIAEACDRFLSVEFGAQAVLLLTDAEDHLQVETVNANGRSDRTPIVDEGVARWAFDHGEAAGLSTDTLPGSPLLYLPLKAPMRTRGVLGIAPRDPLRVQGPEARRQLETFASLVAIAVERMHYVEVAQSTLLQMESESLRNSLLAAISHDLRTPLSVLVGLAESIGLTQPPPTDAQARIAGH
jgi:two-component system sensor histidine kinase KdpD